MGMFQQLIYIPDRSIGNLYLVVLNLSLFSGEMFILFEGCDFCLENESNEFVMMDQMDGDYYDDDVCEFENHIHTVLHESLLSSLSAIFIFGL